MTPNPIQLDLFGDEATMSQRTSGYERIPDERYETIAWPVAALLLHLEVQHAWDPCDRGSGRMVATLRAAGVTATGTTSDFFTVTAPPADITDIVCNPPYGESRRGELAVGFIEHALELPVARVAMLLRVDFDSAISRQHLFRDNPSFAGKIVLLNRIKWFAGPSSPSDNHAWFLWNRAHVGAPLIRYATRSEAEWVMESKRRAALGSLPISVRK